MSQQSASSELTPPELSEIGLCTTTRVSKLQEEKAQAKAKATVPHIDVNDDDELFVKRPTFSKRRASAMPSGQLPGEIAGLTLVDNNSVGVKGPEGFGCFGHFMSRLQAQRWMWCEFAQSFLDEPIAASAFYDLDKLIKDLGCLIGTRTMPRRSWQLVRLPIGKPRRFSKAFIAADVEEWDHLRDLVRQMQQGTFDRKKHESDLPLLPSRVPMPLALDARVTAYMPTGVAHGVVVSHQPKDNTYLVKLVSVQGASQPAGKEPEQCVRLIDKKLQGEMGCESLPLPIMMAVTDDKPGFEGVGSKSVEKCATFSNAGYSKSLLESVVSLTKLMSIKQKTIDAFTALTKDFEGLKAQPSGRRDAKTSAERDEQQRCFAAHMITLHRVNGDLLKPLRILHQYLDEYKEMETQKAKTMSARERFQKCRLQADLDLKTVEMQRGILLKSDATRDLIRTLHTILYLCGALSGVNSSDIRTIIDDIFTSTMENMPPDLCAIFKEMIAKATPLCEQFGRRSVANQPPREEEPLPAAGSTTRPKPAARKPQRQSQPKAKPQPKPKVQPQQKVQPKVQQKVQPQPKVQPQVTMPVTMSMPPPPLPTLPMPPPKAYGHHQPQHKPQASLVQPKTNQLAQQQQQQQQQQHNAVFEDVMGPLLDNLLDG